LIATPDRLKAYRVAELITLTRDGSPVCWPMTPYFMDTKIAFATGYVYPSKAINAKRNRNVAVLFSDPTASDRTEADPLTLVQGTAEVLDDDLQHNTERYVDALLASDIRVMGLALRSPWIRNLMIGYLCRIWIEVSPVREMHWDRGTEPPPDLKAVKPPQFTPAASIAIGQVASWLLRYSRPPVLSFVTESGNPAATRVAAIHENGVMRLEGGVDADEGAPACLTFHRLAGNYSSFDTFIIRGHLESRTTFAPEKVVGFVGSRDDRGVGTLKSLRMVNSWRGQLKRVLAAEGKPMVVARPSVKNR
jgi:hypothetical protein